MPAKKAVSAQGLGGKGLATCPSFLRGRGNNCLTRNVATKGVCGGTPSEVAGPVHSLCRALLNMRLQICWVEDMFVQTSAA